MDNKTFVIIFGILILTSFSELQFGPMNVQTADAIPAKKIVGYFSFWESEKVDLINYTEITNIMYFHIWPNPDGSLNTSEFDQEVFNTIRDRAHAAGVSVGITVGGAEASEGFIPLATNNTSRANFVSNITDFIVTNNIDGLDMDWETKINQAKIDNQDILLSDLTEALHPLGKTVSTAANGGKIDLKANNSIDWVHVMAYDMNSFNAEHSTFEDSVSALQMYESIGFPKEKLVLGIPFYGKSDGWTTAMNYEDIVIECNPFPWQNNCNGHFFNGIDLVQQKARYVWDNEYSGVMVWDLGKDVSGEKSLLSAIKATHDIYPNVPSTPFNLESSPASSTSVLLTWADPKPDEKVTGYKIEFKEGKKDWEIVSITGSNASSYLHRGLTGNDSYQYRIYALNAEGTSNASTIIKEDSFAPKALIAEIVSPTQIKISWTPPSAIFDQPITGFLVEREITVGNYEEVGMVGPSLTSHTISGLQTDRTYTFVVKALFEEGSSPRSHSIEATPDESVEGEPLRCIVIKSNYEIGWLDCYFSNKINI